MHISRFAHKIKCIHCNEFHGTDKWPVNGDGVPFYYQEEPGNFTLDVTCPKCQKKWYVVWDNDPGQIQELSVIKERKSLHNPEAIKRNIKFTEDGEASESCCWNCSNFSILVDGKHWCTEDMLEVNRKDLCYSWRHR